MNNLPAIPDNLSEQIKLIQEHFNGLSEEELDENISKVLPDINKVGENYDIIPEFSNFKTSIIRILNHTAKDEDYINILYLVIKLIDSIETLNNIIESNTREINENTSKVVDEQHYYNSRFDEMSHINKERISKLESKILNLEYKLRSRGVIDNG
jgi:hypothetical protein